MTTPVSITLNGSLQWKVNVVDYTQNQCAAIHVYSFSGTRKEVEQW